MKKSVLLILNPFSGKGQIKNKLFQVVDIFTRSGYNVVVHPTQSENDAFETVRSGGERFDTVVASGGDGTLNEVIRGLMCLPQESRPQLGYIPAGTVNDFASNMKISKNIIKAAENIVSGEEFKCDIGIFNDKNFAYVAAFGALTNVSYDTPQANKNVLGQMAYVFEGIKQLHMLKSYKMKVLFSEGEIEDEFVLGMVANSNHIAGFKTTKALKAQLNDGLFEVLLIRRPKTIFEVRDVVTRLATQDLNSDSFVTFKTDKIKFLSQDSIRWTLDGEYGGSVDIADIKVDREAISMIV